MIPKAFVNVILMGGLAVGRALAGAYKEALSKAGQEAARQATQPNKVASFMSVHEAKKILGVEGTPSTEEIFSKYQKLWEVNEPTNGGSPYIRSKIEGAKQVLEDTLRKGGKI